LVEGTTLVVPAGVMRTSNTAETFTPYDPNQTLGSTAPTAVKPPKSKHSCGVIGQIILVIIAVVVSIYTAGAASGAFAALANGTSVIAGAAAGGAAALAGGGLAVGGAGAIAAGAIGGAVGSIVSQAVGVAAGIQDKFSWNAVALAAIAGGVGTSGKLGVGGSDWGSLAARAVVSNIVTQGVDMATGLQSKFSWAGVAASGVASYANTNLNTSSAVTQAGVDVVADAATRSLVDGTDFGDNVMAALPDVIGETMGATLARDIQSEFDEAAAERARFQETMDEVRSFRAPPTVQLPPELSDFYDLSFAPMGAEAAQAQGLPATTIVAARADGTRVYKLPSMPAEVDADGSAHYFDFSPQGEIVIVADRPFTMHWDTEGGHFNYNFYTSNLSRPDQTVLGAAPAGGSAYTDVPSIGGGVAFISAPAEDPLTQFADGGVRSFLSGMHGAYETGQLAITHPGEFASDVWNGGVSFVNNVVNTGRMLTTDNGRAQIINQVSAWAEHTADTAVQHWNNGTIWDDAGQVFGAVAVADLTGRVLPGSGATTESVAVESGAIDYGSLDALGRPTGVRATITQEMIGTGTPANPSIIPPGWSGNGTLFNEARGHLLGAQLGGSGDVVENLVTLQQNPANTPFMRSLEFQVRNAVEGGQIVQYSATPIYNGTSLVPRGITLSARGSGGYSLDVTVLNPPGY
jgi:hypothetical protein